jgi:transposase
MLEPAVLGIPTSIGPHSTVFCVTFGGLILASNRGQSAHRCVEATRLAAPHEFKAQGWWDRNRTGTLRFWSTRRCVPDSPIWARSAALFSAFTCVQSHSVPFRSIALLPFLLRQQMQPAGRNRAVRPIPAAAPGRPPQRLVPRLVRSFASHRPIPARRLLAGPNYFVPRLTKIWADAAYRGQELADWCKRVGDWDLEVVQRPPGARGFAVQPKRWVVERTFSWLSRNRRMSKDYERKVQTSETLIVVAMVRLLTARQGGGR